MRLNTVMPFLQKATRVSFTSIQDAESGDIIREYYDNGELELRFIAEAGSRAEATVYTSIDLPLFEVVKNIRDRAGALVMGESLWMIKQKKPVLNVLGFTDGYAYSVFLQDGS